MSWLHDPAFSLASRLFESASTSSAPVVLGIESILCWKTFWKTPNAHQCLMGPARQLPVIPQGTAGTKYTPLSSAGHITASWPDMFKCWISNLRTALGMFSPGQFIVQSKKFPWWTSEGNLPHLEYFILMRTFIVLQKCCNLTTF